MNNYLKKIISVSLTLAAGISSLFAQSSNASDTLYLAYSCMVFYSPTNIEHDSLMSVSVFSFDSLSVQFQAIKERISPFLTKKGIESISTSVHYFLTSAKDSIILIRKPFEENFGIIYYSPKKVPLIKKGVRSDSEIFTAMMRYFDIQR